MVKVKATQGNSGVVTGTIHVYDVILMGVTFQDKYVFLNILNLSEIYSKEKQKLVSLLYIFTYIQLPALGLNFLMS